MKRLHAYKDTACKDCGHTWYFNNTHGCVKCTVNKRRLAIAKGIRRNQKEVGDSFDVMPTIYPWEASAMRGVRYEDAGV